MASLQPELHSIHPHAAPPFGFASEASPRRAREPDPATHVLLRCGSLEPAEFERPDVEAIEVMGVWGSTILFATHLSPLQDFVIGEAAPDQAVDFEIPTLGLSATRIKLVEMRAGTPHVTILEGAQASLKRAGDPEFSVSDATSVALLAGTVVEVRLGHLKF